MTNTCWLHVPVHSSEECKALKRYFKKCAAQRLHKENEARSGGETKCGKSVELDRKLKEVNIMEHDDPIPKKKKGGGLAKNHKSESAKTDPEEIRRTYGIDRLKIGQTKHYSDYS